VELRIGPAGLCSGREVEKSSFARFSRSFDFRLLQHYRHETDIGVATVDVCFAG
jgi:hypothetical protein